MSSSVTDGLAQRLVLRIHGLDAGEVQQAVEQHRRVPGREHEPIAVRPDRVLRVEAQEALPQAVDDWRHRHRRARVAGIGLLDGVHRQGPDRVDAELVESASPRRLAARSYAHPPC